MVLTHSVTRWVLLGVIGFCVPLLSAMKVTQPYRVVSTNGTAQVECFVRSSENRYDREPEELRLSLLKGLHGPHKLCSLTLNLTEQEDEGLQRENQERCRAQVRDGVVELTVSGLEATDTDIYRCQIEVFFPPPYLRITGNGTLIHVIGGAGCPMQEAQKQISRDDEDVDEDEDNMKKEPVSIPVVVLVILIAFVTVIIIYFQSIQCRQRMMMTEVSL